MLITRMLQADELIEGYEDLIQKLTARANEQEARAQAAERELAGARSHLALVEAEISNQSNEILEKRGMSSLRKMDPAEFETVFEAMFQRYLAAKKG